MIDLPISIAIGMCLFGATWALGVAWGLGFAKAKRIANREAERAFHNFILKHTQIREVKE